jgi:hypothetical protein
MRKLIDLKKYDFSFEKSEKNKTGNKITIFNI